MFRVRFSGFKVRVVVELSMGVGAGGEGRPPDSGKTPMNFRQNGKKFGQKKDVRKKFKMRDRESKKIVHRLYPVLQPRAQVSLKKS